MSNRIDGTNPSQPSRSQLVGGKTAPGQNRKVEKIQKIEEVSEIDDETKRQKFQRAMEEEQQEEEIALLKPPSPFQTAFYTTSVTSSKKDKESLLDEVKEQALPSPSYSPPPPPHFASKEEVKGEEKLPQSPDFLEESFTASALGQEHEDRPFLNLVEGKEQKPVVNPPKLEKGEDRQKKKKKSIVQEKKANSLKGESKPPNVPSSSKKIDLLQVPKEEPPFSLNLSQQPELDQEPLTEPSPFFEEKEPSERAVGLPPLDSFEAGQKENKEDLEQLEQPSLESTSQPHQTPNSSSIPIKGAATKPASADSSGSFEPVFDSFSVSPINSRILPPERESIISQNNPENRRNLTLQTSSKEKKKEEQQIGSWHEREKEKKEKKPLEIDIHSLPPLAPDAAIFARSATTNALPYLSPNVLSLFYQMVGTIYVLTQTPEIARTEIVLDSPAFASSKFFGSIITIEKYATAPDSLNIQLTGSDEAVTAFNQNIPSLMAAFQSGNYSFRIGRIEVNYSRRKLKSAAASKIADRVELDKKDHR